MTSKGSEGKYRNTKNIKENTNNMNNQKRLIKQIMISSILIATLIVTYIISIYVQTTITLFYQEQSNLDYMVYLKPNNYYETPYLGKDMYYIASLMDYININFNYDFIINENIDYDYKYYIEADLTIFEKSKPNNIIFEKKEILLEDVMNSDTNSKGFNINESLKVNYGEYNNLVGQFKAEYNLLAESNLKLTLYIELDGAYEKFEYPIETNNLMEITIPLTEQMINISMDYTEINNSDQFIQTSHRGSINSVLLVISIIVGLLAILSIIKVFILVCKMKDKKTFYEKRIEKILRNYDRVVVELREMLHIQNEERIIEVISFEELLDVSDRLSKAILFIEIEKNKKSWFIVKNGEEIYRYTLEEIY